MRQPALREVGSECTIIDLSWRRSTCDMIHLAALQELSLVRKTSFSLREEQVAFLDRVPNSVVIRNKMLSLLFLTRG